MSRKFKAEYGAVNIAFTEILIGEIIQEVRIIPRYDARFFEAEFITEEIPEAAVKTDNTLGIDQRLDHKFNLCIKYWVIVYFRR